MAKLAEEGVQVTLITCTKGEEGEVLVPDLAHLASHAEDNLGEQRVLELAAAMRELGVKDHRFLGNYRDSGMMDTPPNQNPNCFWRADVEIAAKQLAKVIDEIKPQVMVTYDEFGGYGHPDHIQTHRVAMRAAEISDWKIQKIYWNIMPKSIVQQGMDAMKAQGSDFFGSENIDEIRWVHTLFPEARSYLDVYDRAGLLRQRAVYAHCIYLDETDRQRMANVGATAAVSPTSNLFLGSGFFDYSASNAAGLRYGLASDVGGGTSFSPFHTMHAAYTVARQSVGRAGISLAPEHLWWQHTAGAAQALDLSGKVGNLLPGCEADFVVLNPQATPLLARRTAQANTLTEWLFAMIVLGDDRLIAHTVVQGQTVSLPQA